MTKGNVGFRVPSQGVLVELMGAAVLVLLLRFVVCTAQNFYGHRPHVETL